jgi:hypothetical protein
MEVVKDANGKIVQRSRNLAGIRRYVSNHLITKLCVGRILFDGYNEAKLVIQFDNGCYFVSEWGSYTCLKGFVRRWRNVYGAPFEVEGVPSGTVSYHNQALLDS